jgi:hypothetical protein
VPESIKGQAKEIGFCCSTRDTEKGFVVAAGAPPSTEMEYLPRVEDKGAKVLVAALYDGGGAFIGGDAVPVTIDVQPRVTLTGLREGDIVKSTAAIGQTLNFLAPYVRYELTNLRSGKLTTVERRTGGKSIKVCSLATVEQNGSYYRTE